MRKRKEVWVDADKGGFYEGLYEVSNWGRWKVKPRIVNSILGDRRHIAEERITTGTDCNGYRRVQMKRDGIRKQIDLHILVATWFIPNPNNFLFVLHKDDIRWNNYFENLRWGTQLQNIHDAIKNGKIKARIGSEVIGKELTIPEEKRIISLYNTGRFSESYIAKMLGVVPHRVVELLKNKNI